MYRILSICLLGSLLTGCTYFNMDNNEANDEYSRCKEIKRQLIYSNATNDDIVAAQRSAEIDNLNRSYRENNCS